RLPTEAEWEYACRAGTSSEFWFGDDWGKLDEFAWIPPNTPDRRPHAVGRKPANPFGLFDMHGNVDEWCQDWYDPAYYARSPLADPPGPDSGTQRVMRSNRYFEGGASVRSANRFQREPIQMHFASGFRVVRELPVKVPAAAFAGEK
ncbi:MAG TPA: SUMF1/EgtB/PvdO family nonheme iron enzyme, partial [Pirellulales bacterium]